MIPDDPCYRLFSRLRKPSLGLGLGLGLSGGSGISVPALDLSFLGGSETLDSRITFTRGSAGTRVNASGVIESISTNNPKFDYDPVTLAAKGLLVEEARTNLFLNALIDGTNLATQDVTVTAVARTISFYGTGSITLTGAHSATINGTGAYPTRTTLTFTPSAGTLTCTVSGDVKYANCEAGSFATSFIPTAGSTVTRSADVASMTGSAFSNFYNPLESTVLVSWQGIAGVSSQDIVTLDDGVPESLAVYSSGGTQAILWARDGGVNQAAVADSGAALVDGSIIKVAAAYKANDFAISSNGQAVGTDTSGTMPTPIKLQIGSRLISSGQAGFWLRSLRYYRSRLPNATLVSLTAA